MNKQKLPSYETLRKLLSYDAETGLLMWLPRSDVGLSGNKLRSVRQFNGNFVGKEAISSINAHGYKTGRIMGLSVVAHRVIWLLAHGGLPDCDIDHINGNKLDNRLCNLRLVDRHGNAKNRKKRADSKYKWAGVECPRGNTWRWGIAIDKKRTWFGGYRCETAAAIAKKQKQVQLGYHENHGRLA